MDKKYTVLITDKNRHVREFLKRELTAEGYTVLVAKDAIEVKRYLYSPSKIDLVILDPELLNVIYASLLNEICQRLPPVPVIVHGFFDNQSFDLPIECEQAVVVEKQGGSIEVLKQNVSRLLNKKPDLHISRDSEISY